MDKRTLIPSEPTLREVLEADIIRLIMHSDHVQPADVYELTAVTAAYLRQHNCYPV